MARQAARGSTNAGSTNSVTLRGRVTSAPLARELPSGDEIVTFRMSMARPDSRRHGRPSSDWVDCVAWGARARRTAATWAVGDMVQVDGALRRRFYRTGEERGTRLEVEVLAARRVRESAS
jgi:single-strand DNA-binding protein